MTWVTDAKALSDYRLWVRFSDNIEGEIDLKDFIASDARPIVVALRDQTAFSAIRVEMDTVVWENGFDLAPEFLYARMKAHEAVQAPLASPIGRQTHICFPRAHRPSRTFQ